MPRLPAEWEPQAAVMLTWPHGDTDWAEDLAEVEDLYGRLTALISRHEQVLVVCRDLGHRARVTGRIEAAGARPGQVHTALADSNDTWARDHGPITVLTEAGPLLVDFRFNGWGGKFPADRDNCITLALHAAGVFSAVPLEMSPLVLEGGSIDTDGAGTLLAVERTLVDERRNPGWTRDQIEAELGRLLGIRRFLWLRHGALSGDDTDGHIDTLARFCGPDTICYTRCEDPGDPDHPELEAMERELRALRTAGGRPYRLASLPHPAPVHDSDGRRLPAGYANFLLINGAVLVPVYGDPADEPATRTLEGLFPGRAVVPIDCRALIRQGGSLHCITMQLPRAIELG